MLIPAAIFVATYVVIALGRAPGLRLDRTGAGGRVGVRQRTIDRTVGSYSSHHRRGRIGITGDRRRDV